MTAASRTSSTQTMTRMGHTSWCEDHANDPTPEAGWCRGHELEIGGIRTHLTQGDDGAEHQIYFVQMDEASEVMSLNTARQLAMRLTTLVDQATPLSAEYLELLTYAASQAGLTVDDLAKRSGVDLSRATADDGPSLVGALAALTR